MRKIHTSNWTLCLGARSEVSTFQMQLRHATAWAYPSLCNLIVLFQVQSFHHLSHLYYHTKYTYLNNCMGMMNSYLWLHSSTRFWTAVSVDASFWPVIKCLSTTTWTQSGSLTAKLAPRSRTASSGMTVKSAKSGSRASSNNDDLKQKEGLELTWHNDQYEI